MSNVCRNAFCSLTQSARCNRSALPRLFASIASTQRRDERTNEKKKSIRFAASFDRTNKNQILFRFVSCVVQFSRHSRTHVCMCACVRFVQHFHSISSNAIKAENVNCARSIYRRQQSLIENSFVCIRVKRKKQRRRRNKIIRNGICCCCRLSWCSVFVECRANGSGKNDGHKMLIK